MFLELKFFFSTNNFDEKFSFPPISLKFGSANVSEDYKKMEKKILHFSLERAKSEKKYFFVPKKKIVLVKKYIFFAPYSPNRCCTPGLRMLFGWIPNPTGCRFLLFGISESDSQKSLSETLYENFIKRKNKNPLHIFWDKNKIWSLLEGWCMSFSRTEPIHGI